MRIMEKVMTANANFLNFGHSGPFAPFGLEFTAMIPTNNDTDGARI